MWKLVNTLLTQKADSDSYVMSIPIISLIEGCTASAICYGFEFKLSHYHTSEEKVLAGANALLLIYQYILHIR